MYMELYTTDIDKALIDKALVNEAMNQWIIDKYTNQSWTGTLAKNIGQSNRSGGGSREFCDYSLNSEQCNVDKKLKKKSNKQSFTVLRITYNNPTTGVTLPPE